MNISEGLPPGSIIYSIPNFSPKYAVSSIDLFVNGRYIPEASNKWLNATYSTTTRDFTINLQDPVMFYDSVKPVDVFHIMAFIAYLEPDPTAKQFDCLQINATLADQPTFTTEQPATTPSTTYMPAPSTRPGIFPYDSRKSKNISKYMQYDVEVDGKGYSL